MATETEPIRQDIDAIRDSMTDKMGMIESKVKGTVDNTVETVKRTFDIKEQVREHPWAALGMAVATGYVLGSMGGSDDHEPRREYQRGEAVQYYASRDDRNERNRTSNGANDRTYEQQRSQQEPGFLDSIMSQFGDELDTVKTAAVAAATSMLRDMLKQNLPQFAASYEQARRQKTPSDYGNTGDEYTEYPDTVNALDRELRDPQTSGVGIASNRDPLFRA
jgi:ElaB/YqjD/DUF883 family membrane-anchored ribosome-binding protein